MLSRDYYTLYSFVLFLFLAFPIHEHNTLKAKRNKISSTFMLSSFDIFFSLFVCLFSRLISCLIFFFYFIFIILLESSLKNYFTFRNDYCLSCMFCVCLNNNTNRELISCACIYAQYFHLIFFLLILEISV